MTVKTIKDESKVLSAPIIWDCFRRSYTQLLFTVPHLIECEVVCDGEKFTFLFSMYNTSGFQENTRFVVGNVVFTKTYQSNSFYDAKLIELFDEFWNDYVNT